MIKDVQLIPLRTNVDDRGYLTVFASSKRPDAPDIPQIREVYLVGNFSKGTIRAFHKHAQLWDYFFISHGSAKFVLVDDRKDSPTHKEVNTFVLSHKSPGLLIVPAGVYHGWMSLEDDTQMVSVASEIYNREKPDETRVPFDSFGDVWSIKFR